jgi:ankyrin repeat protein
LEAHEEIVEFLIGKGADVNQKYLHGYSMLDDAVKSGRKGIAKKLLRGGLGMSGVG